MADPLLYLPIATTGLSFVFAAILLRRYRAKRRGAHLLWWAFGVLVYGLGTLAESATSVIGWHEGVFRAWYICGALLGGAPLAQGTVYLLLRRRTAHVLTALLATFAIVASAFVVAAPVDAAGTAAHVLSGDVFQWPWVRLLPPFINTYALVFLVGGAALSAWRYRSRREARHRLVGNVFIAVGALLPGIGGAFTRFGHTEVLYVTELVGLLLIYVGYRCNVRTPPALAADAMERRAA